jgi:hypothetical protein
LLRRAAPEQVEELNKLFEIGVQARALHGPSPILASNFSAIQISEEFLQQVWLLAHAAWEDLEEFYRLKKNDDPASYDARRSVEAINAARSIANQQSPSWPNWVPQFLEVRTTVEAKATRELFAMACAWAIFHEAQHATLYSTENRPDDLAKEEEACDAYAIEKLFSEIEQYAQLTGEAADKVRGKRAMGVLVGLYAVANLTAAGSSEDPHPPVRRRIRTLFDRIGEAPVAQFWSFAFAMLYSLCEKRAILRAEEGTSMRDMTYLMLQNTKFGA